MSAILFLHKFISKGLNGAMAERTESQEVASL